MPYQLGGAPPGLRGFLMSRQNQQVEQQQQMQAVQQMIGLQGLLQKQQMAPLEMELIRAKVEQAREAARLAPQKAAIEHELNLTKIDKARREGRMSEIQETGLAGLLQQMTRPYQSPQGVAPTDGSQGAPDMVAPTDQAAIQALQAAGGRPMRVDVGNPALTQAYQVMANPQRAIPELIKQQAPPKPGSSTQLAKLMAERDQLPPNDPRRQLYDQAINKATTQTPLVSIDQRQETEEAKTIGKELGQQYADLQKGGMAAQGRVAKFQRMNQLLEGMTTGRLVPTMADIAAIGETFGIKVDPKLGAKQALESLSNEVALTLRNTGEGNGMPGQLSDKDRDFLKAMTPGLAKTPEGNRLIIETGMKIAKRQQETARLAREYRMKNRTMDGFTEFMQSYAEKNPLFEGAVVPQTVFDQADAILNRGKK
jgi:hypothetical protein